MWFVVAGVFVGCAPKSSRVQVVLPQPIDWASPEGQEHTLVGRWWYPSEERFLQEDEVKRLVQTNRVILLGEKHDNIDHHRRQAEVLRWVFEHHPSTKVACSMTKHL